MMAFHVLCPETAAQATRCFLVASGDPEIPAGEYACVELYCEDPKCDCRRTLIQVCAMTANRPGPALVSISYGWDSPEIYLKRRGEDPSDPAALQRAREMIGPFVDSFASRPAIEGPALGEIVIETILTDSGYVERLKAHYKEFRSKLKVRPPLNWNIRGGKKRSR